MPAVIDVHHHVLPDFFFRETNGDAHPVGGLAPAPLSEARALEFMDDAGIDVAIKSISTPRVHVGDDARVRTDHRHQAVPGLQDHRRGASAFATFPVR
jgi:6-methylsalicylate decarboxylase